MKKPIAASVLVLAALAMPAASLAAPPPGASPLLKISPAPVTLPKTTVGNSSQVVEFDVANEGEADALIANVAIEGPDQGAFVLNTSNCGPLGAGAAAARSGSPSSPANPASKQATLSFKLIGAPEPEQNFEISGTGVPAAAELRSRQPRLRPAAGQRRHQHQLPADATAAKRRCR